MIVVPRSAWGARAPRSRAFFREPQAVFFHHTTGETLGADLSDDWVRNIQNSHLAQGWSDIGYSFLFDTYGNIFEGRGWGVVGAHTPNWNSRAHAFAYMGNGDQPLSQAAAGAACWLVAESDRRYGRLPIKGHRDAPFATHCPGDWIEGHLEGFRGQPVSQPATGVPEYPPVLTLISTPSGNGYWEIAADGGVFAYGDAPFHGSMGGRTLNAPVVGAASTPSGNGYWLVASDGGVFAFGDATYFGGMVGRTLNKPISGIESHPSGAGYWLVAADGGVFAFGASQYFGSPTQKT